MRTEVGCKVLSIVLGLSLLLSGCQKAPEVPAPELISFAYGGDAVSLLRTVEEGRVGAYKLYSGVVIPKEYCEFYTSQVRLKSIDVRVGQYVNAGDVLAETDAQDAKERNSGLQGQIAFLESVNQIDEESYLAQHQELEFQLAGVNHQGDEEGAKAVLESIAQLEEQKRYDEEQYQRELRELRDEIGENQKIIEDSVLKASHSGYVTYIKDLSVSNIAQSQENVVVISDIEERFVELKDVNLGDYLTYSNFLKMSSFEGQFAGKSVKLTPVSYDSEAQKLMAAVGEYPNVLFSCEDGELPKVGESIAVYGTGEDYRMAPVIYRDSLNADEEGRFVYVKNGDNKEKRYVETNRIDGIAYEVVSGVSLGDEVYYTCGDFQPESGAEMTLQDEALQSYGLYTLYKNMEMLGEVKYSNYSGEVIEVCQEKGDIVEAGDVICKIQTGNTKSVLMEMENELSSIAESDAFSQKMYEETEKAIGEQITEGLKMQSVKEQLEAQIKELQDSLKKMKKKDPEREAVKQQIQELTGELELTLMMYNPYLPQQLEKSLEVAKASRKKEHLYFEHDKQLVSKEYQKAKQANNGVGLVSVTASKKGKVGNIDLKLGDEIMEGDQCFANMDLEEPYILLSTDDYLPYNQTVLFYTSLTQKNYEMKIIGQLVNRKFHLAQKNGKYYITKDLNSGRKNYEYILRGDDPEIYDIKGTMKVESPNAFFYGGFAVPKPAVFSEKEGEDIFDFVWLKKGDRLVKTYVDVNDDVTLNYESPSLRKQKDYDTLNFESVLKGLQAGDVLVWEPIE